MDRLNWGIDSDEWLEPNYETLYGEKCGMVIEMAANPYIVVYPLNKLKLCVEFEVYL